MPNEKPRKLCVRCRMSRTSSDEEVCKTCIESPARLSRVNELIEAMEWVRNTFPQFDMDQEPTEEHHEIYGVFGAAKVIECVRRLEAVAEGQPLPMPTFVRPTGHEGNTGLPELPDDGRTETSTGYSSVHAPGMAEGSERDRRVQEDGGEEDYGIGEDFEADCESGDWIPFVPHVDSQRTGKDAQRSRTTVIRVPFVARQKRTPVSGRRVGLFTFQWPFGTIFGDGDRVILACGTRGVTVNAWKVSEEAGFRYLVFTDNKQYREVDEDDIDIETDCTADSRPQTTGRRANREIDRRGDRRNSGKNHTDLFGATS